MTITRVIVLAGYGLNCEEETQFAFNHAGGVAAVAHVNDMIDHPALLNDAQILAIPGGFSFGDDTGSGNAFANRLRNAMGDKIFNFVEKGGLVLGICNGCQILVNLGLVSGIEKGVRDLAMLQNASGRYECRWVDVGVPAGHQSPWLSGIEKMHIPVAHGEGRFFMSDETRKKMHGNRQVALQYLGDDGELAKGGFPANPNGSMDDIAAVTDKTGRVLAMMPHPERGMFFTQRDDWPYMADQLRRAGKELPTHADGFALFRNAVSYFKA